MFLDQEIRNQIEEDFEKVKAIAVRREKALFDSMLECNKEEQLCMKFLYAYMPLSDLANYDGELFLAFVRHSLFVRQQVKWCRDLDDLTFFNYCLQYRVNNEDLSFYSKIFYDELMPRIEGLSMYEAAIEVNFWCFEKATYQGTDIRTLSPLSTIKRAYGRCGEESVLTVAALRSVGIPARQCYTPRWSHCDDNHAWVEVFIEGKWHYLGACEPEIKLNRGWFEEPASKGMLIHVRSFSPFTGLEQVTKKTDRFSEINITNHYARVEELQVVVKDRNHQPIQGLDIRFEIVNYAEFYPLVTLTTDNQGLVKMTTGLGGLVLSTTYKGKVYYRNVDLREGTSVSFVLNEESLEDEINHFVLKPPLGGVEEHPLSSEEEAIQKERNSQAELVRKNFEKTMFEKGDPHQWTDLDEKLSEEISQYLEYSRGNGQTLIQFLEEGDSGYSIESKVALLRYLRKKDFVDVTNEMLMDHLLNTEYLKTEYLKSEKAQSIYEQYVLCPRIGFEMLSDYRKGLLDYLSEEEKVRFKEDPKRIAKYVDDLIKENLSMEYSNLCSKPLKTIELGVGNPLSKKTLTVAIGRSLGIPSRFDPKYGVAQFYEDGQWIDYVEADEASLQLKFKSEDDYGSLVLGKQGDKVPAYRQDYTLAYFNGESFETLQEIDENWSGDQLELKVKPGKYRILLSKRLFDGTVKCSAAHVEVQKNEVTSLFLISKHMDGASDESQESKVSLPDMKIQQEGEMKSLSDLVKDKTVVVWIEIGTEPSEHLLNEFIELSDVVNKIGMQLVFVVINNEEIYQKTFRKAIQVIENTSIVLPIDSLDGVKASFEKYSVSSHVMPLIAMVDNGLNVSAAMSGYRVGTCRLLVDKISELEIK